MRSFKDDMKLARTGDEKFARKCRRNFLQYCDDDGDTRITMEEWVSCTGLHGWLDTKDHVFL
jgi:Secreted protein acidic and rich in cysteine Ca binding region